jgi:hypothetical protein
MELSTTRVQANESIVGKSRITEIMMEFELMKKENTELKEVLDNRDLEVTRLIDEKNRQIQSYQYSCSIL